MARLLQDDKVGTEQNASSPQRERIRHTAVRLFNKRGYEATSVKQLAQDLDMAPANLYNYYEGKEAILYDVMQVQLTELIQREVRIIKDVADPRRRLHSLAYDIVLNDLRDPLAAFVGRHNLRGLTGARRKEISRMMAQVRSNWLDAITAGVENRFWVASDPKLDSLSLLTLCSSAATWFSSSGTYSADYVASRTADLVLNALGKPPSP